MSLAALRQSTTLSSLQTQLDAQSSKKDYSKGKENFWKQTKDKSGNATSIIRFLPACNGELELGPLIKRYSHGFQINGQWLICDCPATIAGNPCPIDELNSALWNHNPTIESYQKFVSEFTKRKTQFISNILVVDDPACPANNGKVFLFQYGQRIMDKIDAAKEGKKAIKKAGINPFCPWAGADFILDQKVVQRQVSYADSSWADASCIGDDATISSIWEAQHSLAQFLKPENFDSYEKLQARLVKVLGGHELVGDVVSSLFGQSGPQASQGRRSATLTMSDPAPAQNDPVPARAAAPMPPRPAAVVSEPASGDAESNDAYFAQLSGDDN